MEEVQFQVNEEIKLKNAQNEGQLGIIRYIGNV